MRRILIVEDECLLALRLQTLLEEDDVEVVGPVGMLDEARKLADDKTLDGALLDVNINGGRVDDVVEILRRHAVPFLFVTANDSDLLPPNCDQVAVVAKPFRDNEFWREFSRLGSEMVPKSSLIQDGWRRSVKGASLGLASVETSGFHSPCMGDAYA